MTRLRTGKAVRLAAAVLAVAWMAAPSRADEPGQGGPVVVGGYVNPPVVGIRPPEGGFTFDYIYEHDTDKQQGTTTETTDNDSKELLGLSTEAYVLSPNFIDINAAGQVGLEQESFVEPGNQRYTNSLLYGWDVDGIFRRNSDTPLTVYTKRTESFITPDFSPALTTTDTTYGAALDMQSVFAPTQFQLYHEDDKQTEAGGVLEYELSQDVFHWHTEVLSLPHQSLVWDFNYQNDTEKEDDSTNIKYQDYDASLVHTLNFGAEDLNSLATTLSATDQIGDLAYEELRLDENLRLQHSQIFQTYYEYLLDYTNVDHQDQTNNKLDFGFIHHLFESLTTTGNVGGSLFQESGGGDVEQLFGTLGFGYRKHVPYGLLLSNLDFGYNYQYAAEGTQVTHIINQAETFTDTQPLALTQTNIDPASIKVLSASGVPYLLGKDFTVNHTGNLTQIERVAGGLIPPDATVKLDYDLLPEPSHTTNTGDLGSTWRYAIDEGPLAGLEPYLKYSLQGQSISNRDSNFLVEDSYNDITAGSDYKIWRLNFNAEQEWHDGTLVPFDASRFSARYSDRVARDTNASVTGSIAEINYYGEGDVVDDTSVIGQVDHRLNRDWSLKGRVVWMNDRDQLFGNTSGLEEQLELDFEHNQTKVYARVRNATLNTDAEQSTFQVLEFGLTRSF
jgi:hypothetical protein